MGTVLRTPEWLTELGHGVWCIDTGYQRPGLAAAYLIVDDAQAAFVDTGTAHSVGRLLDALRRVGCRPDEVQWVCPTHVHLDHAGGAGALMRHLPRARVVVHPRGARHLIDPARLEAGVRAVYGDARFERLFGGIVPVPADRVVEAPDGTELPLGGRRLLFLDTPGHALHHYSVWDPVSRGFFTGDTFGLAYAEVACADRPFVFPTTTPVQFDPDAWRSTLRRYARYAPSRMYLTHFGMVREVAALSSDLGRRIVALERMALDIGVPDATALREPMARYLLDELRACGATVDPEQAHAVFAMDLELNAQGLAVWLERRYTPR